MTGVDTDEGWETASEGETIGVGTAVEDEG